MIAFDAPTGATSPPANMQGIFVERFSGSTSIYPFASVIISIPSASADFWIIGFGPVPRATITVSTSSTTYSPVPIGLLLPDASGSPSSIFQISFHLHNRLC